MHACGHDGHTAIGLGLATLAAQQGANWGGRLRIIFQPAEEGCRGAPRDGGCGRSAGRRLFHRWVTLARPRPETGLVSCGTHGWLATTKLDVVLHGVAAHAGLAPQGGRNALLAAATLVLQLHALPRHGAGDTRVNVGILHAGASRNIIADRAELKLEVRGGYDGDQRIHDHGSPARDRRHGGNARSASGGVAAAGRAEGAACDAMCKAVVRAAAESLPGTTRAVDSLDTCGSEDATFFINAVQRRGGAATYLLVGTPLAAGHHQPAFDFDEAALTHAVALHAAIADRLLRAA
jgi:aminobenzoyl-glutamate utilization protein A